MKRIALALAAVALGVPVASASASPAAIRGDAGPARAPQSATLDGYWGGPTTAADGETVNVYVSNAYPEDPAVTQKWADFIASLVHGPEISKLTIRFTTLDEVDRTCGHEALGCYSPDDQTIVAPGEPLPDGTPVESIVAHEYGHHIEANRPNPPWDSNDWGPKRWATAMGVCQKTAAAKLFPGDENLRYDLNPAEIFAEDYRLLNEERLGLPVSPWAIVDDSVQPDQTVLDAVTEDVTDPWPGPHVLFYSGSFRRRAPARPRSFLIQTPLDGTVRAHLSEPKGTAFAVRLGSAPTRETTVCGARTLTATVTRVKGYGSFKLIVTAP